MKKEKESNALHEVRKWKESVAKESQKLRGKTLIAFFNKNLKSKDRKAA